MTILYAPAAIRFVMGVITSIGHYVVGGAVVSTHEQRQRTNTSSGLAVKSGARGLSLIDSGPPRRRVSTLSHKGN